LVRDDDAVLDFINACRQESALSVCHFHREVLQTVLPSTTTLVTAKGEQVADVVYIIVCS
jgi:hypothetical protein